MLKILIIDDSVFAQKIASKFIKDKFSDCELYVANDGQEGFIKYKEINPDYTFIDLLMPKIDGKELIKLIKEYNNQAKIFVLSADVQKNVKEELEAYHIMAFINKPLNEEKMETINNLIRNTCHE